MTDTKMSDAEKVLRIIAVILCIPAVFACIAWSAFVTSIVWSWLMVPMFGVRTITMWQALALGCMFGCFTWGFARKNDVREKHKDALMRFGNTLLDGVMFPAALLGIAWILKGYI